MLSAAGSSGAESVAGTGSHAAVLSQALLARCSRNRELQQAVRGSRKESFAQRCVHSKAVQGPA